MLYIISMKIMLLEKNIDLAFLLQSYITDYCKGEINFIKFERSRDAIDYLKDNHIDLIISEENLKQGTGSEVYSFLRETQSDIYFLLTTARNYDEIHEYKDFDLTKEQDIFMRKPYDLNVLNSTLEKLNIKKASREGYFRVSKRIFKKYPLFNAAIYIRLGEDKYVKMSSGSREESDMEELGRIFAKKITYIYIEKNDYKSYIDTLLANLSQEEIPEESYEFINEIVTNFPVDSNTKKVVDKTINSLEKSFKKQLNQETLEGILDKESYLAKHSELIAYIQSYIIEKLKWGSHNSQIIEKAVRAAFIHDIFMIAEDEKDYNHIKQALDFVKENYEDVDLEKIIQQHHEKPDATGYPAKLGYSSIQPLSACFILSHDLAYAVSEKRDLLSWYYKRSTYYLGSFEKPYVAVKELVIELESMLRNMS